MLSQKEFARGPFMGFGRLSCILVLMTMTCTIMTSVQCGRRRQFVHFPNFRPYTRRTIQDEGGNHRWSSPLFCDKEEKNWIPPFDGYHFNDAFDFAEKVIDERKRLERQLQIRGEVLSSRIHSAEARHQMTPNSNIMPIQDISELFLEASKYFKHSFDLSKVQVQCGLPHLELKGKRGRKIADRCRAIAARVQNGRNCQANARFRNSDGSCNNPYNLEWGMTNTCYDRLLPPDYADGLSLPRVSIFGEDLPNPRVVSNLIHRDISNPADFTHMVMVFGQFISHDINAAPHWQTVTGEMLQCCPSSKHPQCYPIPVPPDDKFYSAFGFQCMNFVRRATCATCQLGYRQPANGLTSFIDASVIYGTSENVTRSLRSFRRGRLLSQNLPRVGQLLPPSTEPDTDQCSLPRENRLCFRAGDSRANQHPALTMVHTTWMRQHNRVAEGLRKVNPKWTDEKLFQEARRIIGAQLQVVVYKEFLPIILGTKFMKRYNLKQLSRGYTTYEPLVDPSILLEFDTAAYRFGHSLIFGVNGRPDAVELLRTMQNLRDNFFYPFSFYQGAQTRLTHNFLFNASQSFDPHITDDVRQHLYKVRGSAFGLDLPAINIHRGRDHGLPGYTFYLKKLFGYEAQSFRDLDEFMPPERRRKLEELYRSVHDIDLFTGGTCEHHVDGGAVGPTFATIIAKQFNRLKFGDRFFYEHGDQPSSFTPDQLDCIRKTRLSKIICSNDENISRIKTKAFLKSSKSNPTVPCESLPDIDFQLWKG